MPLNSSDLDIKKGDSEISSSVPFPTSTSSSTSKSENESENGEGTDWPSEVPEEQEKEEEDDDDDEIEIERKRKGKKGKKVKVESDYQDKEVGGDFQDEEEKGDFQDEEKEIERKRKGKKGKKVKVESDYQDKEVGEDFQDEEEKGDFQDEEEGGDFQDEEEEEEDFQGEEEEEEDFQGEEEEDFQDEEEGDYDNEAEEFLKILKAKEPIITETAASKKPGYGMKLTELRKLQEALTYQEGDVEHPNQMELRVGKIIEVGKHDIPHLYISEVDIGFDVESRLVCTSLGGHYPYYLSLMDRLVVILCNVNPIDDRYIKSKTGMLLLATKPKFNENGEEIGEYVELCTPSVDAPGARIYVEGFPKDAPLPATNEEQFDFVMKDFSVDSNRQVFWRGKPLKIEGYWDGIVTVDSLTDTYCKLD